MIKSLQRKFIMTAMLAVTILIVLMLGSLNAVNILSSRNDMYTTLNLLAETGGDPRNLPQPPNTEKKNMPPVENAPSAPFLQPREERDVMQSAPFFIVNLDEDGNILDMDISRIPSLDEQTATSLAQIVLEKDKKDGHVNEYHYTIRDDERLGGQRIVFLNTTDTRYGYWRTFGFSVVVGAGFWLAMLLLVVMLSRRAIRPIAESIERQKEFVTNAGHEIKTPLAIISANTEALELFQGESKWSRNIRLQTVRLDALMKDMLMLARMEEDGMTTVREQVALSPLVKETNAAFEISMKQKHIWVSSQLAPEAEVKADRNQLMQILSILFDNAYKYTPENGHVYVQVHQNEQGVSFSITNNCEELPNIPPERLFERFYRADSARTQKHVGGYGIGLSMAHQLAEMNQAELSASYTEPDCVTFTLKF